MARPLLHFTLALGVGMPVVLGLAALAGGPWLPAAGLLCAAYVAWAAWAVFRHYREAGADRPSVSTGVMIMVAIVGLLAAAGIPWAAWELVQAL